MYVRLTVRNLIQLDVLRSDFGCFDDTFCAYATRIQ